MGLGILGFVALRFRDLGLGFEGQGIRFQVQGFGLGFMFEEFGVKRCSDSKLTLNAKF